MKKADNFDASKWLTENKITTQCNLNEEKPTNDMVKDYWRIMVKNQPEDVINILVGLTNGDLPFEKFSLDTANDVYDSFRDESYDDEINENDFVFIFVGRIVTDKGINELVEAFSKLNQEINAIKLLLVGPFEEDLNPLKPETLEIIKSHSSIISVGYQNDVRPYFSISNALVFPSYREGFPNVVMQAGAMNLPSIVSDINGCNEIIENNKNGIIIPVKNSTALFVAMKEFVQNSVSFQFMKSNSRSLIENRFEQKMVWESLLNEYESLEQ